MPPSFISTDIPEWIGGMAAYPYSDTLYSRYWSEDKFSGEPFNLSRRKGDWLLVPRELAPAGGKQDLRVWGTKVKWVQLTASAWNSEQARVYAESLALLKDGKSHIVKASTGFGKTWLGVRLAVAMGLKVLIVVPKSDLMDSEEQWRGALKKFGGLTDDQIGIIRQKKCEVEGKVACIGMVHSLAKEKYDESIYDEFGLVIFDEVHRMAADTFQIVAGLFNAMLRLGLTAGATGGKTMRTDGKDFVFEAHIGPVLVKAEFIAVAPKVLMLETPFKLPIVPRKVGGGWKHVPLPHEMGKLGAVLVAMAKCQPRNEMIVGLVQKAYAKDRTTVVFSDLARDKHLDLLHSMLVKRGIPEKDIGFYVGGMKPKDIAETKKKRVVLATYPMTAEATDVPQWDTCVLSTPRANVKQAIGRILRQLDGKKQPIIFDMVDDDSWVCRKYLDTRVKLYRTPEINAEIVRVHLTKQ